MSDRFTQTGIPIALGHQVLPIPECIAPLTILPGDGPTSWIRYERHPAYAHFIGSTSFSRRLFCLAKYSRFFMFVLAKRFFSYELIPTDLRRPRSVLAAWQLVREIIARWGQIIGGGTAPSVSGKTETAILENLRSLGCSALSTEDSDIDAISRSSEFLFSQLRNTRGSRDKGRAFMESRTRALRQSSSDLFDAINKCFTRCGVLQAISAYLGRSARLIDISPQINDLSDDFWRHVFPERGGAIPQTAYLHKDASGGDVKVMIYLSDVGPKNGPFSFVLNSHSMNGSRLYDWIAEANDYAGFSGTDLVSRRRFASLPGFLRIKCAFGNDIENSIPASGRLLASEWKITGRPGTVIIFDSKGFHRGGMVEEGERMVINCIVG